VKIGGGGAYQPQFAHHMFLPIPPETVDVNSDSVTVPVVVDAVNTEVPPLGLIQRRWMSRS
jgi:hypothetical protein